MQIPDEVLKCVAFLYSKDRDGIPSAIGTCFFLGYPLPDDLGTVSYAVTARHVIKNADREGTDGYSHCRLNKAGGGVDWIPVPFSQWQAPNDSRVDLTIAPFGCDWSKWDHFHMPIDMIADDSVLEEHLVGAGDDLFFPGLFVGHQGSSSNAVILRLGNIAAMPGEYILTKSDIACRVYLAECRSIGGLSGSPVFVNIGGPGRRLKSGMTVTKGLDFKLLGVIRGHWDQKRSVEVDINLGDSLDEKINMGIAMVVPGADLAELLNQLDIAQAREQEIDRRRNIVDSQRSQPVDD